MCSCGLGNLLGLGGLVLEKAERGVALPKNSSLQEAADSLRQLMSAAMLGNDQTALAQKWSRTEKTQDAVVLIFFGVGWIDVDEIEWRIGRLVTGCDFFQGAESVQWEHLSAIGDGERFEIAADQDGGCGVILDEDDFGCAAGNCFD